MRLLGFTTHVGRGGHLKVPGTRRDAAEAAKSAAPEYAQLSSDMGLVSSLPETGNSQADAVVTLRAATMHALQVCSVCKKN